MIYGDNRSIGQTDSPMRTVKISPYDMCWFVVQVMWLATSETVRSGIEPLYGVWVYLTDYCLSSDTKEFSAHMNWSDTYSDRSVSISRYSLLGILQVTPSPCCDQCDIIYIFDHFRWSAKVCMMSLTAGLGTEANLSFLWSLKMFLNLESFVALIHQCGVTSAQLCSIIALRSIASMISLVLIWSGKFTTQ